MGGISSIYEDGTDRLFQNMGNKIQTPGITQKKE
jgi:hypothetical protein